MKNVSIQINVPKKIVNVETSLFSVWVSDVGTHRIVWLSSDIHIDRSLNESVVDKIRKYHTDYNNNRPNVISLMSDITSTSGRIHWEFVCLPFLLVEFSSQFKSKITLTHHTHKPLVY